jgi:molybdenum transport protein
MAGGAVPHRLGLSDSILAFDEHRLFLRPGEPLADVVSAMAGRFPEKKIAMEANSPEEVVAFARAGVHVIQCERFEPSLLAECVVALRGLSPSIVVAAAGGVNAANAAEYARTGVDILVTSWPYFGRPKDIKVHFLAE